MLLLTFSHFNVFSDVVSGLPFAPRDVMFSEVVSVLPFTPLAHFPMTISYSPVKTDVMLVVASSLCTPDIFFIIPQAIFFPQPKNELTAPELVNNTTEAEAEDREQYVFLRDYYYYYLFFYYYYCNI